MRPSLPSNLWDYAYGLAVFGIGAAAAYGVHLLVGPFPAVAFFVAVAFTTRRPSFGPTLLVAALSALVLDYFYLPPIYDLNPGQDALLTAGFLAVALLVKRLNDHLREGERAAAQLEGIRLAGTEISHRLNNRLSVAAGVVELLAESEQHPPELQRLVERARDSLFAAGEDLAKLQQVTRVETKETAFGASLDLDRSTDWQPRSGHPAA